MITTALRRWLQFFTVHDLLLPDARTHAYKTCLGGPVPMTKSELIDIIA